MGPPQRGIVHSAFDAAANILFPDDFVLSLNAAPSSSQPTPCMPNGLELTAQPGTFPFNALRAGMHVLFGAQRLHIEAIGCSLDISLCSQWNPQIQHPPLIDRGIIRKNRERLRQYLKKNEQNEGNLLLEITPPLTTLMHAEKYFFTFPHIQSIARFLCGRGIGLTPAGDDMLAGWMATGWLLYGPEPGFLAACQQIIEVAKQQTHLLSQCWLRYAAQGYVALPIRTLLDALTCDDESQLLSTTEAVLALGGTSGYDVIQGMLLLLAEI